MPALTFTIYDFFNIVKAVKLSFTALFEKYLGSMQTHEKSKSLDPKIKVAHTLGGMLQGRKAGTSPFVCTHRSHITLHSTQASAYEADIGSFLHVCCSVDCLQEQCTSCDAILKIEVCLSLLHDT